MEPVLLALLYKEGTFLTIDKFENMNDSYLVRTATLIEGEDYPYCVGMNFFKGLSLEVYSCNETMKFVCEHLLFSKDEKIVKKIIH